MKTSIFFKIAILFLFALFSFFAFSFYFIKSQIEYEDNQSEIKYRQFTATINQILAHNGNIELIEKYLKDLGFKTTSEAKIKEVLLNYKKFPAGFNGLLAKTIKQNNEIFILLETQDKVTLYKDTFKTSYQNYYLITFAGILLLTFLFALVIKSLLPLKRLRQQIRYFSNGKLNINCKINQQDEIGELANEFNNAIKKIAALNESRTLFLRSIMHELKTPITKGRITAEMVENPLQKERLSSAFERLNTLINQFAKIEQLSSQSYKLNKREFLVDELIECTKKMLLIDKMSTDPITLLSPNDLIKADFDLFAIAVKNLLDNAIKYGSDGKVLINTDKYSLIISNKGNPLKMDFKEYFRPYFKDSTKVNSEGFGLGMYIIKNTLDAQNFNITYEHQDDTNYFIIHGCIVENFCVVPEKSK
ncbi:two-component sensor histidine kinase [Helicobacter sp. 12S02232-10]|uniref:ArsS family sensor histidine kinase n=1 Tax=Helicobacter sp. 12S02232-10 TaxID=1476197 RepID=UPI000BA5BCFE|nr:ArsS family sensor histidine kinase [Helicobacter sp. 12S02232-10]PAF48945.1 two-component sensor histidine kinase [Helicobacter sp. 12S02232-10]